MQTLKTHFSFMLSGENMVAVIYSTIGKIQDARRIAHTLVQEQIVACVNIIPKIESYYKWKGKIENDEEVVMIAKTTDKNVKKAIQRIKNFHTYDLPDIIVLPIIGGLKDYLSYIADETS
jgi:periplasmic divalent cation tolerance protein